MSKKSIAKKAIAAMLNIFNAPLLKAGFLKAIILIAAHSVTTVDDKKTKISALANGLNFLIVSINRIPPQMSNYLLSFFQTISS